jgi:rubredoxin-NAD+ reductase
MKRWECLVCGFIYDESEGWPEDGIAAGTRWNDVPDDWLCPDCGMGKDDFEMIEIY